MLISLEEIFKKDNLQNVYSEFLINSLKQIGTENIPVDYKEIIEAKIKNTRK